MTKKSNRPLLLETIKRARDEFHFYNEIHFEKLSSLRFDVYKRLFETTLPHLRYRVGVIRADDPLFERHKHQRYLALNIFTKRVVSRFSHKGGNAVLYLDFKTREKRDNGLTYLLEETNLDNPGSLKAVEVLDSKRSDLMQLSDLYLGVIRYGYELGVRLNRHEIPVLPSNPKKQALYLEFRNLYQQLGSSKSITVFEWNTK